MMSKKMSKKTAAAAAAQENGPFPTLCADARAVARTAAVIMSMTCSIRATVAAGARGAAMRLRIRPEGSRKTMTMNLEARRR